MSIVLIRFDHRTDESRFSGARTSSPAAACACPTSLATTCERCPPGRTAAQCNWSPQHSALAMVLWMFTFGCLRVFWVSFWRTKHLYKLQTLAQLSVGLDEGFGYFVIFCWLTHVFVTFESLPAEIQFAGMNKNQYRHRVLFLLLP